MSVARWSNNINTSLEVTNEGIDTLPRQRRFTKTVIVMETSNITYKEKLRQMYEDIILSADIITIEVFRYAAKELYKITLSELKRRRETSSDIEGILRDTNSEYKQFIQECDILGAFRISWFEQYWWNILKDKAGAIELFNNLNWKIKKDEN